VKKMRQNKEMDPSFRFNRNGGSIRKSGGLDAAGVLHQDHDEPCHE
jgi:hypothetical protein